MKERRPYSLQITRKRQYNAVIPNLELTRLALPSLSLNALQLSRYSPRRIESNLLSPTQSVQRHGTQSVRFSSLLPLNREADLSPAVTGRSVSGAERGLGGEPGADEDLQLRRRSMARSRRRSIVSHLVWFSGPLGTAVELQGARRTEWSLGGQALTTWYPPLQLSTTRTSRSSEPTCVASLADASPQANLLTGPRTLRQAAQDG